MRARFLSTFRWSAKFVLITSLVASTSALSADLTWSGSVSSDWNNPTNWTPQRVPTASDHVIINSGSVTIPANGASGTMDWTGGSISGSLTIATNGVLNIEGTVVLTGVLTNQGTVHSQGGGDVTVYNHAAQGFTGEVWNEAGALWDFQDNGRLLPGGGGEQFHNAGVLQKSAATGTTRSEEHT